jgi:polygalacturonase
MDFGAVPDGATPNTRAFARAIAAVLRAGGGTLNVPAGDYFTGPIELCSGLNLHLQAGARLLFSQEVGDYSLGGGTFRPLVGAKDCHDLEISGKGSFDGRGGPWWAGESRVKAQARARGLFDAEIGRPWMMVFDRCTRVRIEGVTLENSPMYHLVPIRCEDVTVEGVTIRAPKDAPNTDGIDPTVSHRVLITGCTVDTGDDCIAVKAGPVGTGPVEDILVSGCTFLHGHGCSIGSELNAGARNVTVRACTFDGTDVGVRLKSRRGRGGLIENVTYTDLSMRNVGQAIVVSSYYYGLPDVGKHDIAQAVAEHTPIWRNILIRNINATSGTRDAGIIIGLPEMPERGITLENVSIQAPKGLRIAYADGVSLRNVNVAPAAGTAIIVEDTVTNLTR